MKQIIQEILDYIIVIGVILLIYFFIAASREPNVRPVNFEPSNGLD